MFAICDYDSFEFHVHLFDSQDFHQIGFDSDVYFEKFPEFKRATIQPVYYDTFCTDL
jgi:hypothetical protein